MIKLWGRANSSNVMKVIWVLEELKLPYDRVDVGGPFGGTGTAEYRAMNPLGVVPSLEDDGYSLFESNSIMRYLCNAHAPGSSLYPADPRARGTVDAWMDFQQTAHKRPGGVVFQGLVRIAPEKRDHAAIAAATKELGSVWGILDARLAKQDFVAGDQLTLADMAFGPHIHRWFVMPVERPEAPHLRRWYERLMGHPHFATHLGGAVT